jgi:hypothetical protein
MHCYIGPESSALVSFEQIEAVCAGFVGSSLDKRVVIYSFHILFSFTKVSKVRPSFKLEF